MTAVHVPYGVSALKGCVNGCANLILGYLGCLSRFRVFGLWKIVLYLGLRVFFQVDFFTEFLALRALFLDESLSAGQVPSISLVLEAWRPVPRSLQASWCH